jgi:SAM-dependent methyltransferase
MGDARASYSAAGGTADPTASLEDRRRAFDEMARSVLRYRKRNAYYYAQLLRYHRFWIPPGACVLEIGCGIGDLLAGVRPRRGVGIDLSPKMIELARSRHPELELHVMDVDHLELDEKFDYVIMSNLVGSLPDVQHALEQVHRVCRPDTRIIITSYNQLWQPLLSFADRMGVHTPEPLQNWLAPADLENLLFLTGFEPIRGGYRCPFPVEVPLLSTFINRTFSVLPGFRLLGLVTYVVARPQPQGVAPGPEPSVTVVIPCRNERGNIEDAVRRTPEMGSHTEIIFVDGNSTDGTPEEIERVMRTAGRGRDIRLIHQGSGVGKGDAVRKGFAAAKGDVLMILDADLTVPPEDLPKFYRALVGGRGEFVNGTRLVYPMQKEAMRFLNYLGNRFFSAAFTWLLEQRFRDTLCGTKVLTRRNYQAIAAGRSHFGDFDPFGDFDLLFGAAKLNLKIIEVPIRYRERTYGSTNIRRFRHGLLLLRMLPIAFRKLKWQ